MTDTFKSLNEPTPVNVREFRENQAAILNEAEHGAEFVIMSRNRPVARLGPPTATGRRPLGLMKGRIGMTADFDETPADLIALMEGAKEE